jgi:hypothetical protein
MPNDKPCDCECHDPNNYEMRCWCSCDGRGVLTPVPYGVTVKGPDPIGDELHTRTLILERSMLESALDEETDPLFIEMIKDRLDWINKVLESLPND